MHKDTGKHEYIHRLFQIYFKREFVEVKPIRFYNNESLFDE